MRKKKILSLLMAGAMIMASPVAAFADEEYDPKLGDPNSTDTSLKSVTVASKSG